MSALLRQPTAPTGAAQSASAPKAANGHAIALKADRVTVSYATRSDAPFRPLEDFSIEIAEGEITCILGPSGCGKTTLLRSLGGFLRPEPTGGVVYRGRYLTKPTSDIVLIFQENNLYPWLTARGNVRFGARFQSGVGDRRAKVEDMLNKVGLLEAADRYPHQLSGGMRQRAAIARALVSDPRVLLLDEPFSALDVSLRRRMQQLLRKIWEETRKTMVMVTHNVEEAITVGHRVVVLKGPPAVVTIDQDCRSNSLKDRYDPEFLRLQRSLENAIY
ncbi:MAG: ABC transporter ATP-binding protein [Pseudomonadota bacterium]